MHRFVPNLGGWVGGERVGGAGKQSHGKMKLDSLRKDGMMTTLPGGLEEQHRKSSLGLIWKGGRGGGGWLDWGGCALLMRG